ncbi:MAG: hypothetical protein KIH64_016290 [Mycobacterium sp.]|nr:hypothetical protein [Mycobacterium sp.]
MAGNRRLTLAGASLVVLAVLGWLATLVALPFLQQPHTTEDLTAAWRQAGPTPLDETTTVLVPAGQTLVAFLVGTDLYGLAGTTTGTCTATGAGSPLQLGWPVQINRSLTGVIKDGQETVAIAGWTNTTGNAVRVEIRCKSSDSTVDHYVAVPAHTAVLTKGPRFQPWAWVVLGVAGVGLIVAGARRVNPPSP